MNATNGAMDFEARLRLTSLEKDLEKMRNTFQRSLQSTERESNKVQQSINNLTKSFVAFLSIQQAQRFISDIVRVRSEFQKTEITFEAMLKSKKKANVLISEMVNLAAKTPFGLQDVNEGAKRLLAFKIPARQVTETLRRMGDIASGLGVPMGQLIHVYGQVKAQGRLMTNDLYQFMNAGIPIIEELSKVVNKSEQEIKEMVSQGKIGFREIQQVIKNMTNEGGLFYNLMAQQSKTLDGQISNLKDNFQQMLNNLGKSSEGIFSSAISGANYLVENYQKMGKILASLIATYGTYRTAVMSVAVAQSLATQTAKGWTKAQLAQYRALLLVEKAQKFLNTSMLSNPYVLVATAIGGLVATMWALHDSTSASEKALKEFRKEQGKIKDTIEQENNEMKKLLSVIKDETSAREMRTQAYRTLLEKYPHLFHQYKTEEELLRNIEKANKDVELSIHQRIRAENVKELEQAQQRQKEAQQNAKKHNQKTAVTPFSSGADFWNYQDIAQANQEAEKQAKKIKEYQKKIAYLDRIETEAGFKKLTFEQKQQELEKLRELGRRRRNLSQNMTQKQNGLHKENLLIDTSVYEKFETEDVGYLAKILTQQLEQDQKHVTDYQKHSNQLRKKMLEAKKHFENLKNVKGLTHTQLEEEHKKRKEAYEKALKDYEDFTGEKQKTQKSDKKFDHQEHLRQTRRMQIDQELADEKARIDGLSDGYEKERQLIDFHYKEKAEAIRRGAEDMRLKLEKERQESNGQMSQEAFDLRWNIIDEIEQKSNENNLKAREQQDKKLAENLVKEYQTFQEKKDQINKNHLEIEKALRLQYGGNILQEKLKLNEQARQKEISDLELNQKNVTSVISQMYSDLSQKSAVEIERISQRVQKLKQMLEMGEYNPLLGLELGISQETFQTWQQDPKQLESINNHIKNVENTALSSKNVFAQLGENIKKAFDSKNPKAFSEAMGKVLNNFQGISQHLGLFSQALASVGELTNNTGLQDFADDLQNTLDVASNTLQGFAQGGLVGGGIALVTSVVSKIAESEKRHRETIKKIREAEINQQRTLNKLLFEENMLQKDKESVFGVKEISKAVGYMEIYRQQHELLQNSLKKDKTERFSFFNGLITFTRQNVSDLDKIYIKTGRVKTGLFGWGKGRDVFSSITQVYPELIDKTGKFNRKLAESILNSREFGQGHKEALQEIINQYDRMQEAQKQFEEYLRHTFGELGTSIVDSIVHSLKEGEDAFEHFAQAVGKVMGKLGKQLVYDIFIADEFKKLQEKLKNDYENSKVYKEEVYYQEKDITKTIEVGYGRAKKEIEVPFAKTIERKTRQVLDDEATAKKASQQAQQSVADFSSAMRGKMEQMRDVYRMFADQSKALGFDIFGEDIRQAQEKGFARMSQDSADELNGQFRLQTQLQKQNLDVNMQILEKSKGIADSFKALQQSTAQQLKHLAGIEVNTFKLHKIETDIAGVKNILSDMDTKGIKIR